MSPDEWLTPVIKVIGTILGMALTALVPIVAKYLRDRRGIAISAANEDKAKEAILEAIAATEEWAKKTVVPRVTGAGETVQTPPTGPEKMERAKEVARTIAPVPLSGVSDEQLRNRIDARLNLIRPSLSTPPSSYPPRGDHLSGTSQFPSHRPLPDILGRSTEDVETSTTNRPTRLDVPIK